MIRRMEVADEILIAGIKRNDYASYNQLFVRYYSKLCAFVSAITQSNSASEDVVQELFIRLWTHRQKLVIINQLFKIYNWISICITCILY